MRIFLLGLLMLNLQAIAQLQPVGLVVEFESGFDRQAQQEILKEIDGIKPLDDKSVLAPFGITILQFDEQKSDSEDFIQTAKKIETLAPVNFTSILFRTDKGAYGAQLNKIFVKGGQACFHEDNIQKYNLKSLHRHHTIDGVWVYEVDKFSWPLYLIKQALESSQKVEFASINNMYSVLAMSDDTYYDYQWSLDNQGTPIQYNGTVGADMNVEAAWDLATGAGIKVAVLDSGTDTNHVDLVGNLLPGFDATGGGSKGYPNTDFDNDSHGTCSAGIIGALANNDEGIAGIAYDCKIIPVKIFYYINLFGDVIPFTSSEYGTDGLIWALEDANADILSNSWGLRESDIELLGIDIEFSNSIIEDGILNGRDGKGCAMFFSTGNEYDDYAIWPASHPLTIGVGASSMCDELKSPTDCSPEGWWGSNHGDNLDIVAPGVKVLSTDMSDDLGYDDFAPDNNYAMFNGTSAACPNAAGVGALVLSAVPELTAFELKAVLAYTADKTGGYDYDEVMDFGDRSTEMGYGRVNAYAAIDFASSTVSVNEDLKKMDQIIMQDDRAILSLGDDKVTTITLYNLSGQIIQEFPSISTQLVLTDFVDASGLYFVAISRESNTEILKFVCK